MRLILTLVFLLFGLQSAYTVTVTLEQKLELVQILDRINQAIKKRDITPLSETMSPRLLQKMATELQRNVDDLQREFKAELQKQAQEVEIKDFRFKVEEISYYETKTDDIYAFIPTRLESDKYLIEYQTLAVYDDENWYLIQGADMVSHNNIILEIYPFLTEVTFPPAAIKKNENP